jgi:hypothetical protein
LFQIMLDDALLGVICLIMMVTPLFKIDLLLGRILAILYYFHTF